MHVDVEKDHANTRTVFTIVHDIIASGRENKRILAAHVLPVRLR